MSNEELILETKIMMIAIEGDVFLTPDLIDELKVRGLV